MPYADPEVARIYCRDYKRRNRWRYLVRDKAYSAARHANMKARAAGVSGRLTPDEAEAILGRGRCFYCGVVPTGEYDATMLGLDHVVPMSRGGPNVVRNVVACCQGCNASKWNTDRPRRWSRRVDACVRCGTAERRHLSRDMCAPCYRQTWASRAARRERAA